MAHQDPDLHSLDGFMEALKSKPSRGRYFCSPCGDLRKMDVEVESQPNNVTAIGFRGAGEAHILSVVPRSRYKVTCRDCAAEFSALVFEGGGGLEHVLLPNFMSGPVSKDAPNGVNCYLDQAARCESARRPIRSSCNVPSSAGHGFVRARVQKGHLGQEN